MNVSPITPHYPPFNIVAPSQIHSLDGKSSASGNDTSHAGQRIENDSEDQAQIRELQKRDREVRAHEQAHASTLGPYKSGGPRFKFEKGPDGRLYAVGGSVPVDLSTEETPEETIRKAQTIRRAALAPSNPSTADRQVAARATSMEATAKAQAAKEKRGEQTEDGKLIDQVSDTIIRQVGLSQASLSYSASVNQDPTHGEVGQLLNLLA